jgi:hypothetical protein
VRQIEVLGFSTNFVRAVFDLSLESFFCFQSLRDCGIGPTEQTAHQNKIAKLLFVAQPRLGLQIVGILRLTVSRRYSTTGGRIGLAVKQHRSNIG